ncbi:hypothetical protein [Pelagibacterium montanilacus]|uniref:hypothetical protein n=1 Tax=Pelagibacterium montanilacus TaxID=2185280 RepID=UPI000F8F0CAC|nr:hypothetical protein [Pelagibacterium montanilacus]
MNHDISNNHGAPHMREADAHGQAAMLLVECLLHRLIEKQVLSVEEAIDIIDVATEVKIETGTERGEMPATLQASIHLLQDISASLRFDVAGQVKEGTPI